VSRFHGVQGRFDAVAPKLIPLPATDVPTPDGFGAPMVTAYLEPEPDAVPPSRRCARPAWCRRCDNLLHFGTAIATDGVFRGRRVWSKAAIELLTAPTEVRVDLAPFTMLDGRRMAMGGCVFESCGDAGVTVPAGTFCWEATTTRCCSCTAPAAALPSRRCKGWQTARTTRSLAHTWGRAWAARWCTVRR